MDRVIAQQTAARRGRCYGAWLIVLSLVTGVCAPAAAEEAAAPVDAGAETRYVELKPTFVTNFGPATTPRLMYIKTDVALRVAGEDGESAAERHLPALRNAMVLLLSRQPESSVASGESREAIRMEAKEALNGILAEEEGEPYIRDLLFTNFVVQR